MLPSRFFSDLAALPIWSGPFWVLLVKTTIILTAGLAITRSMSRASAGARHLVWLAILATLLVMPALTTWARFEVRMLPALDVAAHAMPRTPAAIRQPFAPPVTDGRPSMHAATIGASDIRGAADAAPAIAGGISLIVAIWAAVVLAILCSLTWSALAVRGIVRRARAVDELAWRTPLLEVADRLGLGEPPRLLVSRDTKMPFACGVFTPTIVLPEECDAWLLERRRAVLLHELAHVQRRDLIGHVLGRVVCAFYWFHPLVWMAAKRLRVESERACDDLALACGTRATDYAEHLLDIVVAVRTSATPVVALAMARRKEFEGRMLAILDPELRHSTPSRPQSAALVASLALCAGLVAAAAPVPRAGTIAPEARSDSRGQGAGDVMVQPSVTSHLSEGRGAQVVPTTGTEAASPRSPAHPADDKSERAARPPAGSALAEMPRASQPAQASVRAPAKEDAPANRAAPDDRAALLAKVLRSDSSAKLRRIAAWGLEQHADSPEGVNALINAVRHDADARVREMAAWSLASSEGHHDVTDALGAALRGDANREVRATAAWALGDLGADGSADALAGALSDSSPDVRMRAAWALGNVEHKQAPPALVAMLRDPDKDTRQLVAWALYQIEDASDLPALEAALRTETDEDTQLAYIRAIAVMGDKSVDAIRGLLESPDPRIKSAAVRALAGGHATGPWPWPWPEPRPQP